MSSWRERMGKALSLSPAQWRQLSTMEELGACIGKIVLVTREQHEPPNGTCYRVVSFLPVGNSGVMMVDLVELYGEHIHHLFYSGDLGLNPYDRRSQNAIFVLVEE